MTREELLKSYILKQYRTVKDFSVAIGLPYTTIDGILRRGVMNTRVETAYVSFSESHWMLLLPGALSRILTGRLSPSTMYPRWKNITTFLRPIKKPWTSF